MGAFELLRFPDAEYLAKVTASEWLKELQAISTRDKPFCIALSGGRIARAFLSAASTLFRNQNPLRPSVHFFWGDERCVPPNDPESNFLLANEHPLVGEHLRRRKNHSFEEVLVDKRGLLPERNRP